MTITLPDGFLWGVAARRAPDRRRQLEQRLVGVRARARHAVHRAVGRLLRQLPPLRRRHRARARPRLRRVPVLDRVVAHRTRGRRVLARRARLLPPRARRRATSTASQPVRHVPPLHDAALDGRARRLGRARDRRPVRPVLRAARSRTSATSSRWRARSTSRTSCRCSATCMRRVPARPARLRRATRTANEQPARPRTARAYDVIKGGPGRLPGRAHASRWPTGGRPKAARTALERARAMHEDQFLEAARGDDFVGVQAYSRIRIGRDGLPIGARSRASRSSSRWATSTGRSRSRRRSGTRST